MIRSLVLVGLGLGMLLALPVQSGAATAALHYFDCKNCHKANVSVTAIAGTNLCLTCHETNSLFTDSTPAPAPGYDGISDGKYSALEGSNLFGSNTVSGTKTGKSHMWGVSDVKPEAGAQAPSRTLYAGFYSRYGSSHGKVTCSRCHDPHGEADMGTGNLLANPKLLIRDALNSNMPMQPDKMCRGCHVDLDKTDSLTINTHPLVADYATKQTARPNDLRTEAEITTFTSGHQSSVQLSSGGVGCVSCHGVHYTDSDSTTADGIGNRVGLNDVPSGLGELLRSDGAFRTGPDRNTAGTGTAQLRSNLCQSCHKYELHGQGLSGDHMLGCLDCHNGHDPVGNTSDYMLRDVSYGTVPTRPNGTNGASANITFNDVNFTGFVAGDSRHNWADDDAGTAYGFCERCHGDVNSGVIGAKAAEHQPGNANACTACHKHNDPANLYSFNRDATAATCGQCHGFPPYLNAPGDRDTGGTDGGYAINESADPNTPYDYVNSTTHEKDETTTGHKVHAGRDLPTSPANTSATDWYFVGSAGVDNCKVCHGPDAGSAAGGHREAPATRPNTFRDVPFDGIAQTGGMSPAYNINSPWTCSNVYCHTNGAPYNGGSRPTRNFSIINTTPPWVGNGSNYAAGGYGSIHGQATECSSCHGNNATTMGAGQKQNSAAHLAHLGGATTLNMAKTFSCSVCHVESATSSTTLAVNAMDGRTGGKHVNGAIDVNFDTVGFNAELASSTYTTTTGVCATYCHNVASQGGEVSPDWDITTDMQCDSCHGGLASDSSGNGGAGPITTGSHSRHVTSATGPTLTCAECHGTNADAGTHAGHFDGVVNIKPAVDTVNFADICQECHGYDAEAGEILPVWGNNTTTDCATCHAGPQCGADFESMTPPDFLYARSSGHNRPSVSGNYPQTANLPANEGCIDCHVTDSALHWNNTAGDTFMLRADVGFPATYAGNENAYCGNCHGSSPSHPKAASANTRNINTHQSKLCVACHNVHGDQNIQMIWTLQANQISHDPSATGKFSADVFFTNITNFLAGNLNSYDEDDGAVGATGEVNSDDICATCHTSAAGTTHNNSNNTDNQAPTGHNIGGNCFTCHASHADATDAFRLGAGTACNDCHGFPPATAAHSKHAKSASNDKDVEDRSDCAFCHTGANLYTYDLGADQADADPDRNNHAVSQANRRSILATSIGYEVTNFSCTTACHLSSAADGTWSDANGLNCNACHYAAASPTGANNTAAGSRALSTVHNEHFDKGKTCSACHDVSYSPGITALVGPLAHITNTSGANEGLQYQGMAQATLDEAAVVRTSMTYSGGAADAGGPNNTCSGGITTGCHASGTPDWDVTIPATSAGCVMCHTETNTAAYNPTSGLHDNSPSGPTVTGNAHDGSFDDGSAGTADCVTCHSASPTVVAANHINGTLNTGTAITVQAIAGYTQGTGTCATTCHSVGTTWSYKWSTSAYNTNGTECANCHGDYASGWNTGVAPHTENPTRGNKHNSIGNLTYPCSDCHGIGSAGYNWTSKWDPTGTNSNHGDDKITMNQVAGTNAFVIDTAPNPDRAGCTTTSCHGNDAAHTLQITTTALTTQTVTGNAPSILCSSCHGGYAGTNANGYWPDDVNAIDNNVEDNSGAHQKHITALALAKYGETLAQLLTNNGNGTADAKQKFLCAYCHNTPGADGDHGIVANLPAEVNSMYALWDLTQSSADNGVWSSAAKTCATTDCHNNKTTPTSPTSYTWYSGSTSACIMCHVDVTAEAKHTAHTGAATNFGRTIGCADCHESATNWGTNTAPASGHINGTLSVAGSVTFTYSSSSCGTNACHNAGDGVTAPVTDPYPWNGAALANCTICHAGTPATGAHVKHVNNTSYVAGSCADCHASSTTTQITAATHIDGTKNAGGGSSKISAAPGNGSCTNSCHLSAEAGDWTGGSAAIACADCHSGSGVSAYIGGDKTSVPGPNYMPQYNMHVLTPTVSGRKHDSTLTACTTCHTTISAQATHVNGVWTADDADNTNDQHRGLFATYVDAASGGSCSGSGVACHADGGSWTRKWKSTVTATDGSECANCHGDFASGWNAGVGHAVNPTRGSTSTHNDTGTLSYACASCHVIGATTGNYPWTTGSNDWKATDGGATTLHGDGFITINSNGTSHSRNENPVGTWKSGCAGCHDGPSNDGVGADDANHDFPVNLTAPSTVRWTLQPAAGDAAAAAGGCDGCHNSGTAGQFWPGHTGSYPSRGGKHAEHVQAIGDKLAGGGPGSATVANKNASCDYCHLNPGESGHNTDSVPTGAADVTGVKRITNKSVDSTYTVNGQGTNYVTCSNIDCHFDQPVTPHWYTDDIAPAAVTLSATAGPKPRSIKVTWNAPGDDNNVADTTPYVYDLRISDIDAATSQNFGLTTNYAGNLPAAYKQGTAAEAVIQNLEVGTTYYFTLKTRDNVGNWSAASNTISATPTADTIAPAFAGANKAEKGDSSQTVYLTWTPAEDHTMPITYKVWRKASGAGALDMDVDAPYLTGVKASSLVLSAADGIANDTIYNFGVRACDALNNCDTNDQIVSATPTAEPVVAKTNHTYRTNGSTTLVKDGAAGTAVTAQSLPRLFTTGANLTYSVIYFVDTFAIYLNNSNSTTASTVTATLGYSTDGANFTSLAKTAVVTVPKKSGRVYQFKFGDVAGKTITSGQRLAIQLTVSGGTTTCSYGSTTNRGDVTVSERIVNAVPTNPNVAATVSGANLNITWTASTDTVDGLADTVHYDLLGSDDNGTTYRYLIAKELPAATTSYSWNTQLGGISGSATMAVKLLAGDGYGHYTAAGSTTTNKAVNNSVDNVAPSAITDLVARPRPKSGSVELTWTAMGDDTYNNGRAKYYDIRYDTRQIVESGGNGTTTVNFADIPVTPTATSGQAINEPSPDFGGKVQTFEVTGLTPLTTYYFAIKTFDEANNGSPISTAKSAGTDQAIGGPRCGMCHATGPNIVESVGNHKLHGYTLNDCTKCHGAGVTSYGLDHQDGELRMGYGPGGPQKGIISGNRIYYTNDGTPGGTVMYDDTDGFGGFGDGTYTNVGDATDDGSCINFGALGVGGCHSFAGTDPDGAGTVFPPLTAPTWTAAAQLNCAICHGNPNRSETAGANQVFDAYGRNYDATTANGGVVPDQIKGAPAADNHGNYLTTAGPAEGARKYIGQHEKHLNYSYRFSNNDSCSLCHAGNYKDVNELDGKHANGEVDVKLNKVAAGPNATWAPGTATTAGTCSNMSPESCHPSSATPKWDTQVSFDCVECHGFAGTTPSHVIDPNNGVTAADNGWATDPMKGNCTYCHFGGHPRDDVGGTSLILANSTQVGIDYKSGGIHIRKTIKAGNTYNSEAEMCWGCHDRNGISEWGQDNSQVGGVANATPNNASTAPANGSNYNYGSVTTSNWTTATWSSAVASFAYKAGAIQSTHSTSTSGTSAVSGSIGSYTETKDSVANIRCSNCHDVHNLNKAPGDTMTGNPYLRGTWIRNPYLEDGAPWNKAYTVTNAPFDAVPRAGSTDPAQGNELGGYQIDQNNNYPTAGLSLASSAGLCTLCHGTNVDAMDKTTGENLWVGTNGHSNAALGGTASVAANIFGNGIGGRDVPDNTTSLDENFDATDLYDMALQNFGSQMTLSDYGVGYRGTQYDQGTYEPGIYRPHAYGYYTWGATVDQTTVDVGYHAFTCSKCHNPHASRLPKLMITNCLDTRHNTWQNGATGIPAGQTMQAWTAGGDRNEKTATWNTAQNCHRLDPNGHQNAGGYLGGWNKVTPW